MHAEADKPTQSTITQLINAWSHGSDRAFQDLMASAYEPLKAIARRRLAEEPEDHTLQPTALVHELWLKLSDRRTVCWKNRSHFFGSIARMMRLILVDHARKRRAGKRGKNFIKIPLDDLNNIQKSFGFKPMVPDDAAMLDDALKSLAKVDPRAAKFLELHFFAGMSYREIAEIEGFSFSTVRREIKTGLLWLRREFSRAQIPN